MKAIVQTEYGSADVLTLAEVDWPAEPDNLSAHSVLVKVHATSIHAGDRYLMRGTPFLTRLMFGGLRKPKFQTLGCDLAGEVVAVGSAVSQFKPGDAVFGDLSEAGFGAWAEYVCVPEQSLALKPTNLAFTAAATVPVSALAALQGLRDVGRVQPGHRVLINGGASGVGSFAIQIAKAFGAEVTVICRPSKQAMVRALGITQILNAPATLACREYDLVLDIAAYRSVYDYLPALKPGGRYILVGGEISRLFQVMLLGFLIGKLSRCQVQCLVSKPNSADLQVLKSLIEAGQIVPQIDCEFSLAQVPAAIRYLEQRQAQGKVAIVVNDLN